MSNTVKLKNYSDVFEEYKADAAIMPGHLIELLATNKVAPHGPADVNALPMFAVEDELQGRGIDDVYAKGDQVQCWIPGRGDIVNAILKDGENVGIGDFLTSAGDGTLKQTDFASSAAEPGLAVIGIAVKAVDMSGSSSLDPVGGRVAVRII